MPPACAAERGVSARSLEPLKECLADLDQLVRQDPGFGRGVFRLRDHERALSTRCSPNFPRAPPLIRQIDRGLGAAVRFTERFRDGAVGAAGAHQILLIGAGPSPHRGGCDREPRRRARRGGDARAFPPRRAQSAAGAAQSHPSRSAACPALLNSNSRIGIAMRFAEQWNWCTVDAIRDVTPTIREFRLRPDVGVAPYPAGSHLNVAVLIDGQPARRSYSLVGDRDPQHLPHRGAAGAGQPRRLARHVEACSRARASKSQARRRCSRSTGRGQIIA